ncbi:MAG: winged helix-turn-helix domain-containing protein [Thermoplasmatales archaeon]
MTRRETGGMRKNRNEVQIIYELLLQIGNGNTQISSILRKVNIPYNKYEELLVLLQERQMIKISSDEGKKVIQILDKGKEFLDQYSRFSKLMEKSYGLRL